MASDKEWLNGQRALEWVDDRAVPRLASVDIACIGASSGGFLSFSGEEFSTLQRSGASVRLIESGPGFGGAMTSYGILGNTVCNDHIGKLDKTLAEALENDRLFKSFETHRWVSPRLSLVGELFETLGSVMVERLGGRIDARFKHSAVAVQATHSKETRSKEFRVFCRNHEGEPFWFSARSVFLALGAHPKLPESLADLGHPHLIGPLEAMTWDGIKRIRELGREDPEKGIHIVGSGHAAAALLSTLGLPDMENLDFTPEGFYSLAPAVVAERLRAYPEDGPKITVWARSDKPQRVVLRADDDDDARRLAADKQYEGPIYRSCFKDDDERPDGKTIYNSHNALETPHAECMLVIRNPTLSQGLRMAFKVIPGKAEDRRSEREAYRSELREAPVVVNATGIEAKVLPLFGPRKEPWRLADSKQIAGNRRRPILVDGRQPDSLEGLYLNGVGGQLLATDVVDGHEDYDNDEDNPAFLKGDGKDLKDTLALGVLQSRREGGEDLRRFLTKR